MQERKNALGRRAMLGGAATAGAAAVVALLAPVRPPSTAAETPSPAGPLDVPNGYQLTEHVKNYYAKARV